MKLQFLVGLALLSLLLVSIGLLCDGIAPGCWCGLIGGVQ